MNTDSTISYTVMRRVRRMRVLRSVLSLSTLSAFVFLLALGGIGREVWVAKVLANMPSLLDLPSVTRFFAYAFVHTDLIVQSASVIAIAALIWLARECALMAKVTPRFA